MVADERDLALAAIRENFVQLQVGRKASYREAFGPTPVETYATLHQIDVPGLYVDVDGAGIVPPGLIMFHAIRVFARYDGPEMARNGIFVEGKRRYFRPVRIGEEITFEGEIADKYVLRGFHYIVTRWKGADSAGRDVVQGLSRNILGYARDDMAADGPAPRYEAYSLPPAEPRLVGLSRAEVVSQEVGRQLVGPTLVARIPRPEEAHDVITRGAALHQHEDSLAQKAGFRGGMVINEFHLSHVLELMIRYFGLDFLRAGEIEAKFIRPLVNGDSMTPRAVVAKADAEGLHLDWWVESGSGENVAVGAARCVRQA